MQSSRSVKYVPCVVRSHRSSGFSLIELLVVIAIIGILAAIIFPVFGTIRENARQNNTMAHLHDIDSGLALYKLDNKTYPPVLFAYACDGLAANGSGGATPAVAGDQCSTTDTMSSIASDPKAKNELVGLYPEYVRDWETFTCADDVVNDANGAYYTGSDGNKDTTQNPQPNYLQASGALVAADGNSATTPFRSFFFRDAMDLNPQVIPSSGKLINNGTYNIGDPRAYNYMIRYQTSWTSWDGNYNEDTCSATATPAADNSEFCADYQRQLAWQNPPADTVVTTITDHVPNANKLLVLYVSGTVQNVTLQQGKSANGGWDDTGSTIAPVTAASGCTITSGTGGTACTYSTSNAWKFNPANKTNH